MPEQEAYFWVCHLQPPVAYGSAEYTSTGLKVAPMQTLQLTHGKLPSLWSIAELLESTSSVEEFWSVPAGFCQLLTVLRKGKLRIQYRLGEKKIWKMETSSIALLEV